MSIPGHKAIIILYIAVLGSAGLATSLFMEGRNYPATGWTILTFVFVFFVVLEKYLRRKEIKVKDYEDKLTKNQAIAQAKCMENFVIVLSSKDPIKVYAIKDALSSHNIECVVLDSHSSQMMGFLPDVKMRVMVRSEDFDESVKIIDSIKELKQPDA
jgi:hypothetical protein